MVLFQTCFNPAQYRNQKKPGGVSPPPSFFGGIALYYEIGGVFSVLVTTFQMVEKKSW